MMQVVAEKPFIIRENLAFRESQNNSCDVSTVGMQMRLRHETGPRCLWR